MRGKGRTTRPAPARARITPACAGKRKSCAAQKTSAWDHPRMCGEKLGVALLALAFKGSPPHVRGKGASKECGADRTQDHPRMCGEKGSRSVGFQPYKRITPACAGKSCILVSGIQRLQDHPRMCGEKGFPVACPRCRLGSPPHVRGKD